MKDKIKSRRAFLFNIFGDKKANTQVNAQQNSNSTPQFEKTKMLTPDGKLVEVSGPVLKKNKKDRKTSNADILKWITGSEKN
jgi:hypothetical protein